MTAPLDPTQPLVLVTGPSGAGRSTAINALEDFGFEAIDNMPISLVPRLLDGPRLNLPLALGLDVRNRDFAPASVLKLLEELGANPTVECHLLFLDAKSDTLIRRYSETRRRHPLAKTETPHEGISRELEMLAPLRAQADILVDTSDLTPHDLRAELARWFAQSDGNELAVTIQSFSYKRGLPRGADLIFDCRFLNNPHWQEELRPLNGTSVEVASYVEQDPRFAPFYDKLLDMVDFMLPAFKEEGKTHLSIAMGCTGGQHRSVAVTERLGKALANKGWQVSIRHRELGRHERGGSAGVGGD